MITQLSLEEAFGRLSVSPQGRLRLNTASRLDDGVHFSVVSEAGDALRLVTDDETAALMGASLLALLPPMSKDDLHKLVYRSSELD